MVEPEATGDNTVRRRKRCDLYVG